jgi:small-conductance mechanosensitive channel
MRKTYCATESGGIEIPFPHRAVYLREEQLIMLVLQITIHRSGESVPDAIRVARMMT